MENIKIIPEEIYQKIKKEMGKLDDFFTKEEYIILTKKLGEIQAKFL